MVNNRPTLHHSADVGVGFAFDGDKQAVDERRQREVVQQLHSFQLSFVRLKSLLDNDEETGLVIAQYRAAKRELLLRQIKPILTA